MTAIVEDYVSFETAKLLKEKGFDVVSYASIKVFGGNTYEVNGEWIKPTEDTIIPTLQMAMKWLRETHHIFIDIDYDPHEFGNKPYFTLITNMDTCDYYIGRHLPVNKATYEEMAEAAIKYCLENLI